MSAKVARSMLKGGLKLLVSVMGLLLTAAGSAAQLDWPSFNSTVIDADNSGDCKAAGDIDGDQMPDLVVGGMPAEGLSWYHYPTWRKTLIARPSQEFTTDCALGDVDADGVLDIVVPDGESGDNLKWFRNPAPAGDPFAAEQWQVHTIGQIGGWGKDVHLADFDGDGRLDVATRHHGAIMIFFQDPTNAWSRQPLPATSLGGEGLGSGDIDGDGAVDLVISGAWLRNPGGASARTADLWTELAIGEAPGNFKALIADLDGDGAMDVAFSSSEDTADVQWWSQPSEPGGSWSGHVAVENFERGHTLRAADMDNDGDLDLVLAHMHTAATHEVLVLENVDGRATRWLKHVIDTTGLHNGVVADIDNDSDMDIFGANWVGNPPVRLWVNRLDPNLGPLPLDRWTPIRITRWAERTFGLGFADVNDDGVDDIIAGPSVYLNPGADMTADWERLSLPSGMHAFGAAQLTNEGPLELLAQRSDDELELHALTRRGTEGWTWRSRHLGSVPLASHDLGAQGYRLAQLEAGGPPEIVLSSGDGLYYFAAPDARAATEPWRSVHVSANPSDEGVAVGDIDGDGLLDLAATTGEGKGVEWYRSPGSGGGQWASHRVGEFSEAVYPDRIEIADLSGDGRPDLIVSEENGEASGAETFWWEQPERPDRDFWPRHLLTVRGTTNSLDVADFNRDGVVDIVTAEHRGGRRVIIWRNEGAGSFTPQEVSRGRESHLGAQAHDLDDDGDLDLVSIGYDESDVWLWRNDAIQIAGLNVVGDMAPAHAWLRKLKQYFAGILY
jgi:FG-GAP-like repeat